MFLAYQMMFAQITPALITGAFANRVRFKGYLVFLVCWLLFVYFPIAHMVFILVGVVAGAFLMPTFIRLFSRGLGVLEQRGTAMGTMWYGITHAYRLPHYLAMPGAHLKQYLDVRRIRWDFLMWNVLVTCFYSIGLMSTFLAAARDLSLNSTSNNLSGMIWPGRTPRSAIRNAAR